MDCKRLLFTHRSRHLSAHTFPPSGVQSEAAADTSLATEQTKGVHRTSVQNRGRGGNLHTTWNPSVLNAPFLEFNRSQRQRTEGRSMSRMTMQLVFLVLLFALAQSQGQQASEHRTWNYREGADMVNINGVRSITRLLNHWGNRIFKQVKETVLSKPQEVLPDYARIQPFSEALEDLFREARLLKRRLGVLTETLSGLERAVAQVGYGKPVKVKRVVMKAAPGKHRNSHRTSAQTSARTVARRRPAGRRQPVGSNRRSSRVKGQRRVERSAQDCKCNLAL
ncbi:uncharacterized protein [Mobula birostris]|uniref:uncharacterized protein n=1 Tax=Mobula birostris TaxID=1983395 RepID=UPI003B27B793